MHSLLTTQQVGEHPFQVFQLVQTSSRQLGWHELLPGSVSQSSLQLCLFWVFFAAGFASSERNSQLSLFTLVGGTWWIWLVSGTSCLYFELLPSRLRSFPVGYNVSISEETVIQVLIEKLFLGVCNHTLTSCQCMNEKTSISVYNSVLDLVLSKNMNGYVVTLRKSKKYQKAQMTIK